MTHLKEERTIAGHNCTIYSESNAEYLLIQPTDANDRKELDTEVKAIELTCDKAFVLAAIHIDRWFDELPPWPAPPVFGKKPFGNGAPQTLNGICRTATLLKASGSFATQGCKVVLGGYSLAGLFALWAAYQYAFDGIVAASPSVWYPQWIEYAGRHIPQSSTIYLSLGDREDKSRTPIMTTVSSCIRQQHDLLLQTPAKVKLEWNEGNHFQDNGLRTAKGFAWVMSQNDDFGQPTLPCQ